MSEYTEVLRNIRTKLLKARLQNLLTGANMVYNIVSSCQPTHGLDNESWIAVTQFVLELEPVKTPELAKTVIDKYMLVL